MLLLTELETPKFIQFLRHVVMAARGKGTDRDTTVNNVSFPHRVWQCFWTVTFPRIAFEYGQI